MSHYSIQSNDYTYTTDANKNITISGTGNSTTAKNAEKNNGRNNKKDREERKRITANEQEREKWKKMGAFGC